MNVKEYIEEYYPGEEIIIFDGLDDAFIGVGYQFNKALACYDREKIIDTLIKDGMTAEEAIEYHDFNIVGSYLGEGTPIIIDSTKLET
jgi:hypothetical protein